MKIKSNWYQALANLTPKIVYFLRDSSREVGMPGQ